MCLQCTCMYKDVLCARAYEALRLYNMQMLPNACLNLQRTDRKSVV